MQGANNSVAGIPRLEGQQRQVEDPSPQSACEGAPFGLEVGPPRELTEKSESGVDRPGQKRKPNERHE
jgi:hypothetical protein